MKIFLQFATIIFTLITNYNCIITNKEEICSEFKNSMKMIINFYKDLKTTKDDNKIAFYRSFTTRKLIFDLMKKGKYSNADNKEFLLMNIEKLEKTNFSDLLFNPKTPNEISLYYKLWDMDYLKKDLILLTKDFNKSKNEIIEYKKTLNIKEHIKISDEDSYKKIFQDIQKGQKLLEMIDDIETFRKKIQPKYKYYVYSVDVPINDAINEINLMSISISKIENYEKDFLDSVQYYKLMDKITEYTNQIIYFNQFLELKKLNKKNFEDYFYKKQVLQTGTPKFKQIISNIEKFIYNRIRLIASNYNDFSEVLDNKTKQIFAEIDIQNFQFGQKNKGIQEIIKEYKANFENFHYYWRRIKKTFQDIQKKNMEILELQNTITIIEKKYIRINSTLNKDKKILDNFLNNIDDITPKLLNLFGIESSTNPNTESNTSITDIKLLQTVLNEIKNTDEEYYNIINELKGYVNSDDTIQFKKKYKNKIKDIKMYEEIEKYIDGMFGEVIQHLQDNKEDEFPCVSPKELEIFFYFLDISGAIFSYSDFLENYFDFKDDFKFKKEITRFSQVYNPQNILSKTQLETRQLNLDEKNKDNELYKYLNYLPRYMGNLIRLKSLDQKNKLLVSRELIGYNIKGRALAIIYHLWGNSKNRLKNEIVKNIIKPEMVINIISNFITIQLTLGVSICLSFILTPIGALIASPIVAIIIYIMLPIILSNLISLLLKMVTKISKSTFYELKKNFYKIKDEIYERFTSSGRKTFTFEESESEEFNLAKMDLNSYPSNENLDERDLFDYFTERSNYELIYGNFEEFDPNTEIPTLLKSKKILVM